MINKLKFVFLTLLCVVTAMSSFLFTFSIFDSPDNSMLKQLAADLHIADPPAPPPVSTDDIADENEKDTVADDDKTMSEVMLVGDKINENTLIVYEYYYREDGKILSNEQFAPDYLFSLTRSQLESRLSDWKVVSFSPSKVIIRKTVKSPPVNTYILGESDGYIAVFNKEEDGGKSLKEITDTPITSLSDAEQKKIISGIVIEGETELMRILEDYDS